MSRLRMTFSRLLALGGFTLGGSTFAYYRYNLLEEQQRKQQPQQPHFSSGDSSPDPGCRSWDDDWDLRNPSETSPTTITKKTINKNNKIVKTHTSSHVCNHDPPSTRSSSSKNIEIPILDSVSETVTSCPVSACIVERDLGSSPCATRHVLLVRHGQYVYNDDDSFRVLTDLGR